MKEITWQPEGSGTRNIGQVFVLNIRNITIPLEKLHICFVVYVQSWCWWSHTNTLGRIRETNVSLSPVLLSILTNEHCTNWTAKFGLLEYFSISFIWPSTYKSQHKKNRTSVTKHTQIKYSQLYTGSLCSYPVQNVEPGQHRSSDICSGKRWKHVVLYLYQWYSTNLEKIQNATCVPLA